ncbi:MAG: winged helix-turn-helix transcriptional regulator [Syntrophomonadaceae bacterium]|jgi:ArsR family transcriptional regulator|nr:winged helix-turn-helix transcriptional regulator [Syntrophomonadaceae bacterium]
MYEVFFKALGEPTRLGIIRLLAQEELCVCELEELLKISQPRISQHLRVLKQARLLTERKEGTKKYCQLDHENYQNTMISFMEYMKTPLTEFEYKELSAVREATRMDENG